LREPDPGCLLPESCNPMMHKTLREQVFGHWRAIAGTGERVLPSGVLPNRQEFWRPPAEASGTGMSATSSACRDCGAEFVPGAGFCHVCGSTRSALPALPAHWTQYFELQYLQRAWGLSTAALVACCLSAVCVFGALLVGLASSSDVRQWEDIQVTRIEWLLGAGVALLAANLLKRTSH
jgi:hypothetical protein